MKEKGKAINLEVYKEEYEEILEDEEDLEMEVETQGVDPITRLQNMFLHAREKPRCRRT